MLEKDGDSQSNQEASEALVSQPKAFLAPKKKKKGKSPTTDL